LAAGREEALRGAGELLTGAAVRAGVDVVEVRGAVAAVVELVGAVARRGAERSSVVVVGESVLGGLPEELSPPDGGDGADPDPEPWSPPEPVVSPPDPPPPDPESVCWPGAESDFPLPPSFPPPFDDLSPPLPFPLPPLSAIAAGLAQALATTIAARRASSERGRRREGIPGRIDAHPPRA
jgi:hypothetical protein